MTPDMEPMKRCASCGKERRLHDGFDCADGGRFKPVTIQWAGFQAEQMAAAKDAAIQEAIDLLLERIHHNPARSAAHNARLTLQAALSPNKSEADQ